MKPFIFFILFSLQLAAHGQLVGINTMNPFRGKLEVQGGVDKTVAIFGTESTGVSIQKGTPKIGFNHYYNTAHRYIGAGYAAQQYVDQTSGFMAFELFGSGNTNSVALPPKRIMRLNQNGSVYIGQNNYNATLSVDRHTAADATAFLFGTTHHSALNFGSAEHTYIRAGKDGGTVFINDIPNGSIVMTGPVGVNTATPAAPLEIRQFSNKGLMIMEPVNFNKWEMVVSAVSGNLMLRYNDLLRGQFSYSNGSYSSVSDRRLKKNIKPVTTVLQKLMQLKPVTYEMIHNNPKGETSTGFIAQEVKELFPELVQVVSDSSHGYKGIDGLHTVHYNGFSVVAVKAVQEQQHSLDEHSKRLKALSTRLAALDGDLKK